MYDQHVTRDQQGEPLAHLSAVSDAPRTDSEAGAARSVRENGIESTTYPANNTFQQAEGGDLSTRDSSAGHVYTTLPVDAGAAYLVRPDTDTAASDASDEGVAADESAEGDADDDLDLEVTMREVEKPRLMAVPGFDQMFEEIEDQWQERALCAQTDPEAFFPEKGGSTREAKRICLGCDVKDECLEYALANDERFGIWGGLSERERRRLKRGIV